MLLSENPSPRVLGNIKAIPDDTELLRRYAEENSETDFAQLVQRHLDLVYSAALRQVGGDTHRAEDVTQMVFTDLARKARALRSHPALAGWLYTSAHFAATKLVRSEMRRSVREKAAHLKQVIDLPAVPEKVWDQIRPVLDDVMHELDEPQRAALVLRFFNQCPMAEVAERLGLTESAARKRIDRTLEKLRALLARRGIDSTSAALASVLVTQTVIAAPEGLAFAISGTALAGLKGGAGSGVLLHLLAGSKLKLGITAALAAIGLGGYLAQRNHTNMLRESAAGLRRQYQAELGQNLELQRQGQRLRDDVRSGRNAVTELQNELAALRNQPPSPQAAGITSANEWSNLGQKTPEDAFVTIMWALHTNRLDALEKAFTFDPGDRVLVDLSFAGLPENIRMEYDTPAKLASVLWANSKTARLGFTGSETVGRQSPEQPGDVTLDVVEHLTGGEVRTSKWRLLQGADGEWRSVYPGNIIEVWGLEYGVFPSKAQPAAEIIQKAGHR